jgi:PilZ domain
MSFGKRQPIGFLGVERRHDSRQAVDCAAEILLPATQVKCRVFDISKTGARVSVASTFGLPTSFELRALGRTYHVSLARRSAGHVGVTFV